MPKKNDPKSRRQGADLDDFFFGRAPKFVRKPFPGPKPTKSSIFSICSENFGRDFCSKNVEKNSVIVGIPGKYVRVNQNKVDQEILKKLRI